MLDITEMFIRVVFSFVVGNSDMHLKNFSLIETFEGSNRYVLSEAYDLLSTNAVIPADKEQMALTVNEKKQNIRRKDFLILAKTIGISQTVAEKIIAKTVGLKDEFILMCEESYLPSCLKETLEDLICRRTDVLSK